LAKTDAINIANPSGGSNPRLGDDYIRALARAVAEILGVDHYIGTATDNAYTEDDAGKHKLVTFRATQGSTPSLGASDVGIMYIQGSPAELYFEDAAGNAIQLTDAGKTKFASLGNLANATYLKAKDPAGTGTVDLIKAGRNEADNANVPILPDGARLATNAAPAEDTGIANKKYVADSIAAIPSYRFGSVDFKNNDTSYQAATDGFVMAVSSVVNAMILGYQNTSDSFGDSEIWVGDRAYAAQYSSITMPVKEGMWWKVTGATTVRWMPVS
jgi:hypothetical protein